MPLTEKGKKIKSAMAKSYGKKLGEKVFYSLENKNAIKGVTTKANSVSPPKKSPSPQRKK